MFDPVGDADVPWLYSRRQPPRGQRGLRLLLEREP